MVKILYESLKYNKDSIFKGSSVFENFNIEKILISNNGFSILLIYAIIYLYIAFTKYLFKLNII